MTEEPDLVLQGIREGMRCEAIQNLRWLISMPSRRDRSVRQIGRFEFSLVYQHLRVLSVYLSGLSVDVPMLEGCCQCR